MAKIPFDIKFRPQIESGEYKVETEAGYPVKVMDRAYNAKACGKSIAIKVTDSDGDHAILYTHHGKRASIFPEEGSDLIIITPEPKPELSEFEKKVADVIDLWHADYEQWTKPGASAHNYKNQIKQDAAELLALARKEIEKDLPRWVKVNKGDLLDKYSNYLLCSNEGYYYCSGNTITRDGYVLLVDDLEKLPKEDEK